MIHLARLCRPTFRIPWDLHAIAQLPECQEQISKSTLGHLNAEFLGMSEADLQRLPAKDLPSFDDMFDGPNPGPYVPGKAILQKSPLIHCNSSIWSLGVDVYYPAARDGQGSQLGFAGDGPYPLVAFSPGLGSYPGQHKHMLENLASQGYIVVSQVCALRSRHATRHCIQTGVYGNLPGCLCFEFCTCFKNYNKLTFMLSYRDRHIPWGLNCHGRRC